MNRMTQLKVRRTLGVGAAVLLAAATAPVTPSQAAQPEQLSAQEIAAKSRAAYAALSSYSDSGQATSEMAGRTTAVTFHTRLQRPALYRIDWAQGAPLKGEGVVWSDGSGNYLRTTGAGQEQATQARPMPSLKKALVEAAGLSFSAAATVPGAFFNQDTGDLVLLPVFSGRYPLNKEPDAKVGDVDCYVVSCVRNNSKQPGKAKPGTTSTTLWIGKKDFLIHQCRSKHVENVDTSGLPTDQAVDEAIKKSLEMQHKPVTPEAIAAMRPQMRTIMKQVQGTLKSGFASGLVYTQTHENIVVDKKLSPADFTR